MRAASGIKSPHPAAGAPPVNSPPTTTTRRTAMTHKYTFEVEALNGSLVDPSPAEKKFTIKR